MQAVQRIQRDATVGVPYWVYRDVGTLQGIRHPNIWRLAGPVTFSENDICIPYQPHIVKLRAFRKHHGAFNDFELKRASRQLFDATAYLHDIGVYHRSLSTDCVLVNATIDRLSLSDFGHSVEQPIAFSPRIPCVGLPHEPPEILLGDATAVSEADVWALGCIVLELATCRYAFLSEWQRSTQIGILMTMFDFLGTPTETTWPGVERLPHFSPRFPKFKGKGVGLLAKPDKPLSKQSVAFISRVLQCNPAERPSCRAVLADTFFLHGPTIKPEVLAVTALLVSPRLRHGSGVSLKAAVAERSAWCSAWCFGKEMHRRILAFIEGESDASVASNDDDSRDVVLLRWLRSWLTQVLSRPVGRQLPCGWLCMTARRHLPSSQSVLRVIPASIREQYIAWMLQCCVIFHAGDVALFHAILTFDRFWASQSLIESAVGHKLNCVCVTACFIAFKLFSMPTEGYFTPTLISRMSSSRLSLEEVMDTELLILESLGFEINVPSAYSILQTLLDGLSPPPLCKPLAEFLLHLSVSSGNLHFDCQLTTLGSAALLLSLQTTLLTSENKLVDVSDDILRVVTNEEIDVAAVEELDRCTEALWQCWVQSTATMTSNALGAGIFLRHVYRKFSRSGAAGVEPPLAPLVLVSVLVRQRRSMS
eukprot:TRINITY_DN5824_c0_g1_i3.p1 TRINITY_DN5824_c0_g1~~TRINITY_DN5824_c0_g1_i3.p1  ORF type:complete len:671 (+),score=56.21 TRINITY_DN5824_c0_g1_i3:69-2015(+)